MRQHALRRLRLQPRRDGRRHHQDPLDAPGRQGQARRRGLQGLLPRGRGGVTFCRRGPVEHHIRHAPQRRQLLGLLHAQRRQPAAVARRQQRRYQALLRVWSHQGVPLRRRSNLRQRGPPRGGRHGPEPEYRDLSPRRPRRPQRRHPHVDGEPRVRQQGVRPQLCLHPPARPGGYRLPRLLLGHKRQRAQQQDVLRQAEGDQRGPPLVLHQGLEPPQGVLEQLPLGQRGHG
mmetsp:Transcript_29554/g.74331  ORF Transcript_29554/g.74331 Transcript_29554/m.74331 type:complete len:231 (+) Transcript_29554:2121-2813(+)